MDRTTPLFAGLNPEAIKSAINQVADLLIDQELAGLLGETVRPSLKATDQYLAAIQILEQWIDSLEGGGK